MVTSRLLVLSALFVAAPLAAFASGGATVGVKIAELRIKPDEQAFSRLKIPGGREVAVLGKSDDGRWIKVRTEIEKGEDIIKLEGWLEAAQLKGADIENLSVASGGSTSSSSASSSASTDTSSEWGETPAASEPSSGEAWDTQPAATSDTPAAESSPAAWESESSSSESAPAPAAGGDEWGSTSSGSSDSGSTDSGSSGSGSSSDDGW